MTIAAHESPSEISRRILSVLMVNGSNPENLHVITPLSVAGVMLIASGTLLRMWCYRTMKNLFTFDVSIRKDHKLVTTGPYGVVRHPSYSGIVLVYIGAACWFGSRGSWLRESGVLDTTGGRVAFGTYGFLMTAILVALLKRGAVEDRAMRQTFGKQWDEWALKVPYSFVPWIC